MLFNQGGSAVVVKLLRDDNTHSSVLCLCQAIVRSLRKEGLMPDKEYEELDAFMK
jgi:hypothetical protein